MIRKIGSRKVVLFADTRRTVVRICETEGAFSSDVKRRLFEKNFPLGEKMNEKTHVFDGCVFSNVRGRTRAFLAALPIELAEEITEAGAAAAGGIHRVARLSTVECVLFERYSREFADTALIFYPQDGGIRVLAVSDNLPESAAFISTHEEHRAEELARVFAAIKNPPSKAVLLNGGLEWLRELLAEKNLHVEEAEYAEQENKYRQGEC